MALNAQSQVIISGFITDAKTNETLIGAYVHDTITGQVVSSNTNGYYSMAVNKNSHLVYSYVGYTPQAIPVYSTTDTLISVFLTGGKKLGEVTVKARQPQRFNTSRLTIKEIEQLPSLGGSPDVLKAMQLLPGIQGQSESSSMLIVRGGDPGQNLYLLDETPLIYVNHLGGFLSVFNPDMMNDVSLSKGGFPPQYGGKLSSVVNITQKKGNASGRKGSFGISITDINGSMEGPLGKKGTYIITARKTLFDFLLLGATKLMNGGNYTMRYGFHDINSKFTWQLNPKNKLSVNLYQGDDYLHIRSKLIPPPDMPRLHSKIIWGNWLAATRWTSVLTPRLNTETALSFTRYRTAFVQSASNINNAAFKDRFSTAVNDFTLRHHWNCTLNNWSRVNAGLNSSLIKHVPYRYTSTRKEIDDEKTQEHSFLNTLYADLEINATKLLTLNTGIRAARYNINNFTDWAFEPRLRTTAHITNNIDINASYMQVKQYSHLLFTTGNIASNEVWVPANNEFRPATSDQLSAGLMVNFLNQQFHAEISGYYKDLENLSTYKAGEIDLKGDINWPSRVETGGRGFAYGLEFYLKKNYGDFTGSIGYTYSRSFRKYPNINNNQTYPFAYDRPHSLTVLLNRKLNPNWDLSMTWVYQSGLPYTPVVGRQYTPSYEYYFEPSGSGSLATGEAESFYYEALIYGEHNNGRIKPYHRLDVGLQYHKLSKRGNRVIWSFSVYNAYNRQNPNYYYFDYYSTLDTYHPQFDPEFKPLDKYQVSFFPILPSVGYKVYFEGKNREKNPIKDRFINFLMFDE